MCIGVVDDRAGRLSCPVCGSEISTPDGVNSLPINRTLLELVTSISNHITSSPRSPRRFPSARNSGTFPAIVSSRSTTYLCPMPSRRTRSVSSAASTEIPNSFRSSPSVHSIPSSSAPVETPSTPSKSRIVGGRCPVCSNFFGEECIPRLLMCFHTFCEECLSHQVKDNSVLCPKCKISSELPEEGIEGLIRNYAIQSVTGSEDPPPSVGKLTVSEVAERMGAVCPVCQESFLASPPRLMRCGHSVCYACIKSIYFRSQKGNIKCPQCRELMRLGPMGLRALPINHALATLLQEWCRLLSDPHNVHLVRAPTIPTIRVNEEMREELEEEVKHLFFSHRKSCISETTYVPSEDSNSWEGHIGNAVGEQIAFGVVRDRMQVYNSDNGSHLPGSIDGDDGNPMMRNRRPFLIPFSIWPNSLGSPSTCLNLQSSRWLICMFVVVCLMCAAMIVAIWWAFAKNP